MGKIKVTDWGSYIIPEEREKVFDFDQRAITRLNWPLESKENLFNKKWGDYKIIPA